MCYRFQSNRAKDTPISLDVNLLMLTVVNAAIVRESSVSYQTLVNLLRLDIDCESDWGEFAIPTAVSNIFP